MDPRLLEEPQRAFSGPLPEGGVSGHKLAEVRRLILEMARRKCEALKIYEPLPLQELFHKSLAPERLARGSNRSGKTLVAAVELARAATGQDPYNKYPKEDGRAFLVGKDGKHVGQVMYRKLFRAGAFKMIRDLKTGQWRAFRPWHPDDFEREKQAKPAPPLIPPRFIKEIAWENKREGVPNLVRLHNGWELSFFSSLGKPPQGSDVDVVWLDEEIVDADWYPEASARLIDRSGRFFWSATPQAGTMHLFELHERAEDERSKEKPTVQEFYVKLADNPHLSEENKQAFADKLQSEEEKRVRIEGEFLITSFRVYPNFTMATHGVDYFEIPQTWTRYAAVDPGKQVCAVLFLAVPPPGDERGDHLYLYDELYLKDCDADRFGRAMAEKTRHQDFEAFILDAHWGRHTETGSGLTVEAQYTAALRKHKVKSRRTAHGFLWGSDDVDGGIEAVRGWLRVREDGTPLLRVLKGKLPNFEWEMKRYHFKRVKDLVTDTPVKRHDHLADCTRYLALCHPKYRKPQPREAFQGGVGRQYRAMLEARKKRRGAEGAAFRLGPTPRAESFGSR